MMISTIEDIRPPSTLPDSSFRHVCNGLAYDNIQAIRQEMTDFFEDTHIDKEMIGNFFLALTEILSNLIKHPEKKATHVEVRIAMSENKISLSILDNSTPFNDFEKKRAAALSGIQTIDSGAEGGYGLGMVLSLYKEMTYRPGIEGKSIFNQCEISQPLKTTANDTKKDRKKIFLIDDDFISLHIHHQMLKNEYDVITFLKAEDALTTFVEKNPDMVISDLNMPGLDGIGLRMALNKLKNGNTTPFIFLSGQNSNESNPYVSQLGIDDFLCKPVTKERLETVVTRLLHRSRQTKTAVVEKFHHDITELLKPEMPESYTAWNFMTRHVVADAGGGDFIMHNITQTNMMTILVDVMGHGRQAKFFSYVYAGYLRSMFRLYAGSLDTSHFLRYLSQSIDGDTLLESMVMTCQCFQIFPEGIIKISSAGHPHPILVRGTQVELIDVAGPLPGLLGDSIYDMKSIRLERGDRVIFMTDGFLETFDRQGRATEELVKKLRESPALPTPALTDFLWKTFQEQEKKQISNKDDATIIIAEYRGNS